MRKNGLNLDPSETMRHKRRGSSDIVGVGQFTLKTSCLLLYVQAIVGSIAWVFRRLEAKVSGDERPRLHALQRLPPTFLPFPSMEQNYNPLRPFKTPADFSSRSIEADSSHLS